MSAGMEAIGGRCASPKRSLIQCHAHAFCSLGLRGHLIGGAGAQTSTDHPKLGLGPRAIISGLV